MIDSKEKENTGAQADSSIVPAMINNSTVEQVSSMPMVAPLNLRFDMIPESLKGNQQWVGMALTWNSEKGKFDKKPISPVSGYGAKSNDSATWSSFETASNCVQNKSATVAYALSAEAASAPLVVIDIDHCIVDGVLNAGATALVKQFAGTYIEKSVSGDGVHIFVHGTTALNGNKKLDLSGATVDIEVYSSKRFIAMTGNLLPEGGAAILNMQEQLTALESMVVRQLPAVIEQRAASTGSANGDLGLYEAALSWLSADSRSDWFRYGIALKRWGVENNQSEAAWEVFDRWSKTTTKQNYDESKNRAAWDTWDISGTEKPVTVATIIDDAKKAGFDARSYTSALNGKNGGRPKQPAQVDVAEVMWRSVLDVSGFPCLRWTRGQWWSYNESGWVCQTPEAIKPVVVTFMQNDEELRNYSNTHYVASVMMNLQAYCLCGTTAPLGSWITSDNVECGKNWIAFANGTVINVENWAKMLSGQSYDTRMMARAKSAAFFSKSTVSYAFDPDASAPEFSIFLNRVMPNQGNQRMLQQMAGLSLSDITHYHAMHFLIGSGANGKSVFADILTELVGRPSVCHVEPSSLGDKFQTWPLIENKLNITHDMALFDGGHGAALIEALIKKVVCGEPIEVQKKFQQQYESNATARFVFVTNSLPKFQDRSDAMQRRSIIIPFTQTIPQSEQDRHLATRIIARELPGVFNWAIQGLADILKTNALYESEHSFSIKQAHFDCCCVEKQFLQLNCALDPEGFIGTNELYVHYSAWCNRNNHGSLNQTQFTSSVMLTYQGVTKGQKRNTIGRERGFIGLKYHGRDDESSTLPDTSEQKDAA